MSASEVLWVAAETIMRVWRPGSHGDEWTWDDERADLESRHELRTLTMAVRRYGVLEPVQLGYDGRVWDGHHRILAAFACREEPSPALTHGLVPAQMVFAAPGAEGYRQTGWLTPSGMYHLLTSHPHRFICKRSKEPCRPVYVKDDYDVATITDTAVLTSWHG